MVLLSLRALLCACLLPAALGAAQNLVFNGGFELGTAGYELVRYQRLERNPTLAFEELAVDTASFHSGTRSLRVPNRHGENAELFARGITLKQGTRYSVSVWMKSERGGLAVTPTIISNSYYPGKQRTFTVGTAWTKHAFAFTTGADEVTGNAIWFVINSAEATVANDLWIDDFQVYEDPTSGTGAAAFTHSAEVELAATTDQMIYQGPGKTAAVTLAVHNSTTRSVAGSVDLRLEEDHGAPPRVVGAVSVTLAPGERKVLTTPVPLERYGSLTLVPVAHLDATAGTLPAWFVAVPKYVPAQAQLDLDTTFCVGASTGLHNGRGALGTWRACGGPATKLFDVYATLGGRLIRSWDAGDEFHWRTIEAVQGQMDFTRTDFVVQAMYDRGISSLPVLGSDFLKRPEVEYLEQPHYPEWLLAVSPESAHTQQWLLDWGAVLFLPSEANWRRHVAALANRYRGKIDHWEVLNEPSIHGPASEYVPYLAAAAVEIKAADPAGEAILSADKWDFLDECIALGAESSSAINCFHPYDSTALGSPLPADAVVADLKAASTKLTHWVTECYWLNEGVESGDASVVHPIHVARRFLTDLGEGIGQSICLSDEGLWKRTLNPGFGSRDANSSYLPSANLVAYDALACHFEGAKPKAKIRWGDGGICYVYERGGAPVAACWIYSDTAPALPVTLPAAVAGTTVLDVFGNAVASPGGLFTVVPTPQYLLPAAGVSTADFIAALQAAAPLKLTATPAGVSGAGKTVVLKASVTAWPGRTISSVAFTAGGVALGSGTFNAATQCWENSYTTVAAALGSVALGATAIDSAGRTTSGFAQLVVGALTYGNGGQPWAVPTSGVVRIRAENFDQGGEGFAYHEYPNDTGNGDWLGRSTGTTSEVDLYRSAAEGLRLGAVNDGEWINYTLNVPTAGKYEVRLRVSNEIGSGRKGALMSLKWKGSLVATKVVVPQTNNWDEFTDLDIRGVTLSAGTGTLQVYVDTWGWSFAWLEIGPSVTVVAGNNAPKITTARPAAIGYSAGGSGAVNLAATDADNDGLTWSIPLSPLHGTATVSSAGRVTFVPSPGFSGEDSLQVRVADGRGGSDTIRVDCTILPTTAVKQLVAPAVAGAPVLLAASVVGVRETASVTFYADGVKLGTGTLADCGWGVLWTPPAAGTGQITARATDVSGVLGPLSAALAVKVVAKGTPLIVTDECGTVAPPSRAVLRGVQASDSSTPPLFGDASMLSPVSPSTAGQVTWVVPNASAFWFSYAVASGQLGRVSVGTSPDGITFTAATPVVQTVGVGGGRTIFDAAVATLPAGTTQVRVTLDAGAALLWVQIDSVAGGGSATPVTLPANFKVSPAPVAGQGGQFQIVFGPVQPGFTYTPEYCTDLAAGQWLALSAYTESNNSTTRTITDLAATGARRFYRLRLGSAP
ncbi:MAG: carbohydrate binding domain-containing protein [Opitutaceae bacterium]|nr:carbohydrate binding domain-containing protein [Opitutaceae bacterium]